MGSSSKTVNQSSPWGPTKGLLQENALPRIEEQYQADISNPNRLVPQAQSYGADVLSGKYLDPSTNPHLGNLTSSIWESVAPNVSSVFSRAGRGTSANNSGLGGALTRGFTSAMAQPLFGQYNTERGLQQQIAAMAPQMDAAGSQPLDQYLSRVNDIARMGTQGSSTTSSSGGGGQAAASIALMALMMMSDRRAKTDIKKIAGTGLSGINVYRYRYKSDEPGTERTGLMAQEVEKVIPEAVATRGDGYKMVDYAAVGRAAAERGVGLGAAL